MLPQVLLHTGTCILFTCNRSSVYSADFYATESPKCTHVINKGLSYRVLFWIRLAFLSLMCLKMQITRPVSVSSSVSLSHCTFSAGEKQFLSLTWASMAGYQELWESLPQRENASQLSGKTKPPPEQARDPTAEPEPDNLLIFCREKPSFLSACWCGRIWYTALLWWNSDTGYIKTLSVYCQQEARRVLVSV